MTSAHNHTHTQVYIFTQTTQKQMVAHNAADNTIHTNTLARTHNFIGSRNAFDRAD